MGIFSKTKRKSKPYQAWLCEDARFFGKLSAEEQVEFINEQKRAKLETKAVRLELEALEHSFNRQSEELKKLREVASTPKDTSEYELLFSANERIEKLKEENWEMKLRLGVFDDIVSISKSSHRTNEPFNMDTIRYHETVEGRISEYLNKA